MTATTKPTIWHHWAEYKELMHTCPDEGDEAGQARWRDATEALALAIATTPSERWADVRAKLMLLRSWREDGTARADALDEYLIAGAIIDIDKLEYPRA